MNNKCFFLLFFLLLTIICRSQFLYQVYSDTVIKWNYYFGDEFENEKLDVIKWNPGFPWSRTLFSQDIIYLENNLRLKDGNIICILNKKDTLISLAPYEIDSSYLKQNKIPINTTSVYPFKYTGGLIWSNQNFKYGYFEIKFKAPHGQGVWPAFWLYGGKPNYEIDFFELKGEKKKSLHVDVHCPDKCENFKEGPLGYRKSWGHWIESKHNLSDSFNVVSGEWTEQYIKYYLNGELIAFYNKSFDVEMGLTLGTGVAKDGKAFKPGPNKETPFPNEFFVDYVRVWKNKKETTHKSVMSQGIIFSKISENKKIAKNTKSKSKIKYFNDIKKKEKNLITISILPIKEKKILITALSKNQVEGFISFIDPASKKIIKSQKISESETFVDLNPYSSSSILFSLKIGGKEVFETLHVE